MSDVPHRFAGIRIRPHRIDPAARADDLAEDPRPIAIARNEIEDLLAAFEIGQSDKLRGMTARPRRGTLYKVKY